MPDKKISDLTDGGLPQDSDEFVVARAGTNNKLAWSSMSAAATAGNIQVTLDGNTAGVLAPVSSGTLTIAGGNNITVSQNGNAITLSGANIGGAQTGISGLANSQATYTSGTVELVGTGAITIASDAGQKFVLSVDPQSVQPETQTFIGGLVGSDATYTSGTVTLSGVGGGVTVRSNTGQRIDISVAAQSVQPETQTFIAGISASDTLYTSGNVRISGSNAATVKSGTGQLVIIDVPTQSVQPETQTFIAGISASDTLYTSGNVRITGVGGGVTVSSNTGQRVDISVAAQSVQPETQTFIAGISASDTLYTSGNVRFTGVGGGITVSSNTGQRVDLSVAAQSAQTGISGIANSQTTYTSGTVSLSELGAITIRSTTGNQFQLSVNSQTVQTQGVLSAGVSTGGNTAGNTTVNTGSRLVLVGSNGITASQGTAAGATTITLSGITQSVQTNDIPRLGVSTGGNTSGDTTVNSGTRFVLVGSNNITLSQGTGASATTITISGPTTAAQTVQTQGIIAPGVSTGGNTAGDTGVASGTRFILVGTNMVSLSQTTGANATTVSINATNQNLSIGVSTGGNTAGNTTVNTGSRFVLVGSNGITASAGTAAGATTVTLSGITQSVQTNDIPRLGVSTGGNTAGDTTVNSGTRFVLVGTNMVSLSQTTGASATTISINATNQNLSVGASNVGNTAGDTTVNTGSRLVIAGGNNITVSQGTAAGATTLTISAPNLGAGAFSGGASNLGNTAGATGITGTQLVLVGTNMISLSQTTGANGGTLSINATQSVQTQGILNVGVSTGGATSGDTGVASGTRFVLVGTNLTMSQGTAANATTVSVSAPATSSLSATGAVEISTNGSTISIGAPSQKTLADVQNFPLGQATLMTHAASISKTPFYFPMSFAGRITQNSFVLRLSAVTTATLQSFSIHAGYYTQVNSTSMALLGSWSEAYVQSTASSASWSGIRNYVMTGIGTHTALSVINGGDYVIGLMFSAGAAGSMAQSIMGAANAAGALGRIVPGTNQQSTGTSQGAMPMHGRGSTTVNALPANVVASELVNQGQGASLALHPWIYIRS